VSDGTPVVDIHDVAKNFIELASFKPVEFQKNILKISVDPWQEEATEAVFDVVRKRYGKQTKHNHEGKNFFTVRAMHGPGKTFWLASLILTFGFAFPKCRIPCIAPKMNQLRTRLWLELRKIVDNGLPEIQNCLDIQATTVKFFNQDDWVAFAQTATKAENLAGLHNDFILVCVDEASGIPEHLWATIFGSVSTGKVVVLVMISNPTKITGTFAESWLKPSVSKDFYQIAIDLEKAPRVSKKWVESMASKYGSNSPAYKIRCLGEFSETNENQLIAMQWIVDAIQHDSEIPLEGDGSIPRLVVSVDVADGGEDETVIVVGRHWNTYDEILKICRFSFPSSESPISAAKAAAALFDAWGGVKGTDVIVVDSIGVGAGTAGRLIEMGHAVVSFKAGEAADDKAQWRNKRVQCFINLRNAFRDKTILVRSSALPDNEDREEFIAQLCSIQSRASSERVEDLVSKNEMKRQGIKSPDIADALSMQYATKNPNKLAGLFSFDDIVEVESSIRQDW